MEKKAKPLVPNKNIRKEMLQALSVTTARKDSATNKKNSASSDEEHEYSNEEEASSEKNQKFTRIKMASEKNEVTLKPNAYEPINTESMDTSKSVYIKCKQDTLGRAEPVWETYQEQKKPKNKRTLRDVTSWLWKRKWVAIGVTMAVMGAAVLAALSVGVAAHARSLRLDCIKDNASESIMNQGLLKTRELPLETEVKKKEKNRGEGGQYHRYCS